MLLGRRSIFHRLVLAFFAVGLLIGLPLVLLSIEFNKRSSDARLRQSVGQQIEIIEDNFRQEFSIGLQRSLRQVTSSEPLGGYLLASLGERVIKAKVLEKYLLGLQGAYQNYTGIYYLDDEGRFVVNVADGRRNVESGNVNDPASAVQGVSDVPTRAALQRLFTRIRTTPLLLSSGNMEWFMPPREVAIDKPFLDGQGRLSFVAGLALVDYDSGGFGGVVFIRVRLDEFTRRLQSVKFLDLQPVWLFGADGVSLMQPPPGQDRLDPTQHLPTRPVGAPQLLELPQGLVAVHDLPVVKDQPFVRLAYAVPESAIARDFKPAVYFFLLVLLLAMAAVFLLAFFISRNFSTPIVRLADAAARLADGDMSDRVHVAATGEIQVLVDSFNGLIDRLQAANQNRASAFAVLRRTVDQMKALPASASSGPADLDGAAAFAEGVSLLDDSEDLSAIQQVIDKLIAEREENLRKVRAARDAADEANRVKGDFLATMSHEIRTPLNAVIGLSEILAGTALSDEQRRLVRTMESAGGQLLRIINDILDLSRLQSGRVEVSDARVDLRSFMNQLMLMIGGLPHAEELDIRCLIDPAVPDHIVTDEARLMQILTNLLGNAVKFTPQGRVSVSVEVSDPPGGARQIRFVVSDSGPGVPPDMREAIFEPFTQGAAERLRPHAGSGLGLAICRRLAQALGGSVALIDQPPPGACFVLTLPLRDVAAPTGTVVGEQVAERSGEGLRVLVAEDAPANQLVIRVILEGAGYAVTLTSDGREAVDAFQAGSFDLVILDMQMPVMDGYEAARHIRASGAAGAVVPIVALTAFTQESDRQMAMAAGFTAFASKPVRGKEFKALLSSLHPAKAA